MYLVSPTGEEKEKQSMKRKKKKNKQCQHYKKIHICDILGRMNFFPVILMTLL